MEGVTILLVRSGLIAVSKRINTKHLTGFWQFPGGTLEPMETPIQAAQRELKEETGLNLPLSRFQYLGENQEPHPFITKGFGCYVLIGTDEELQNTEPDKHSDWEWVSFQETTKLNLLPGIGRYIQVLNSPTIGTLTDYDASYLQNILVARWEITPTQAEEAAQRYVQKQRGATGFVAKVGAETIGVCLLDPINQGVDITRGPWITGLWVEPSYRKHGIGQSLMRACEIEATRQGFNHVYLDTIGAEAYHAKHEWETIGTAKYQDELVTIMQKNLKQQSSAIPKKA